MERLEKDAREAKKGLWPDPQPVPPQQTPQWALSRGEERDEWPG